MTTVSAVRGPTLERPRGADVLGVLACVAAQVCVIAVCAALGRGQQVATLELEPISVLEIFTHNASVFLLWLAGAATLGLATLVLATFSSAASGLAIGAAWDEHGLATLSHLGHAVFEVPALAIALWLSLRPLGWALRSLRGADPGVPDGPVLPGFARSLAWWLPIGGGLLLAAAAWEASTPFLPAAGR